MNEGVVGPDGAFWVGTMHNNIGPDDSPSAITADTGRLYRFAPDGSLTCVCDDLFGITNTLLWPTRDSLVTADTTKNVLYRYRLDPTTGRLSDRRILLEGFPRGLPDGSCLDGEGTIWAARVAGGGCLTRTTIDGAVTSVVDLPCSWPTSCAFGGPDLDTLFATSGRFTMSAEHLAAHPAEGGLFALAPGVRGRPAYRFGRQG